MYNRSSFFDEIYVIFYFRKICQLVHDNGGQVYLDGANMNAQVSTNLKKIVHSETQISENIES